MSAPVLDRAKFELSTTEGLVRLARFVGVPVDGEVCRASLIAELERRVGSREAWPPRITERRW